ncbi:type II toxin-antitoxin system RelE/ParE family toxin [Desulfuromonas sp. CSMB_57]|jgi:toxin ParE1/3/4|uniref:type II toxin-antitoxin system RelE/ParE family toxin n=1 Tax=Desulfuromonas sp. CSMB_57 TaxID=2807629 RepID=UPI001CD6BE08|nr:type II toxin-antitoxin system RelE/ParE family toxin [Desulfuromonas sp. CSMB_57]
MSRVTLTPKAKGDLDDIWDFTFARWGMDQAEKYVRELWAVMEKQATDLATSIDIADMRPGYRKVYAGSHVIFFKVLSDGIDVVRILHQKMDFNRHL